MLTTEEIKKIFNDFNNLTVLIIGDVMIDSYLWGKVERISPEAPVPIVAVNKRENRLGGAANVAVNIHALGAETIICSVIGKDAKANEFYDILKKLNLSSEGIIQSDKRITTVKFRIIGNNSQMLRVDEEINNDLNAEETKQLINKITKIVNSKKIDIIIIEDYNKGIITPLLIDTITTLANQLAILVAVDPKKENFTCFKNISLFKPNLKELKEGLKFDISNINKEELHKTIEAFQLSHRIENILITLSEQGIFISRKNTEHPEKNEYHLVPAHIRNISDVSGAGDTVISVASLLLASHINPKLIASIANLAGGLVCEYPGVVPINKQELLQEIIRLEIGE